MILENISVCTCRWKKGELRRQHEVGLRFEVVWDQVLPGRPLPHPVAAVALDLCSASNVVQHAAGGLRDSLHRG